MINSIVYIFLGPDAVGCGTSRICLLLFDDVAISSTAYLLYTYLYSIYLDCTQEVTVMSDQCVVTSMCIGALTAMNKKKSHNDNNNTTTVMLVTADDNMVPVLESIQAAGERDILHLFHSMYGIVLLPLSSIIWGSSRRRYRGIERLEPAISSPATE